MQIWDSIVLGAVQGFTEFLPVSSSGHLVIFQEILGFSKTSGSNMFFDILLHFGTLVAVLIAFWGDVVSLVKEFIAMARNGFRINNKPERRFVVMILITLIFMVPMVFISKFVESFFTSSLVVGFGLLVTAALLFFCDRTVSGKKTQKDASYRGAVIVGIMQAFAVLPGISRSGATITGGIFSGFSREFAVKFAFIISIPVIIGANIFSLPDAVKTIEPSQWPIYMVGVAVSAITGFLAIKLVRHIAKQGKFKIFSVYCAVVGIAVLLYNIIGG